MNRAVSVSNMEKLAKSFEALKGHQQSSATSEDTGSKDVKKKDVTLTKKDYIANLTVVAEGISAANFRSLGEFPKFLGIAMELFLTSCNDNESDIRLKADECLNKVIKACMESSLGRLQLELYKEIKKNGPSRSLRAALWRFAEMAHLIRPQKCRPYVINLLPSIARISRRPEDIVQEALMNFLIKTLPVLGSFLTDTEVKNLMKVLFPNLKHTSATTRRTAARCIVLICQYGRKHALYFSWLVQALLMFVIPVKDSFPVQIHLGVLLCLRYTIPHLVTQRSKEQGLKGSFGVTKKEEEAGVREEQLIKIYEYLIHCTKHSDHNVLTATLDALQQLLRDPPKPLFDILMSKKGIARVSIYEDKEKGLPKDGEETTGTSPPEGDESSNFAPDSGLDEDQYSASVQSSTSETSTNLVSTPTSGGGYSTGSLESIPSSLYSNSQSDRSSRDLSSSAFPDQSNASLTDLETSEIVMDDGNSEYLSMTIGNVEEDGVENSEKEVVERAEEAYIATTPSSDEVLDSPVDTDDVSPLRERAATVDEPSPDVEVRYRAGDIGSYTDQDLPLRHLLRLLASSFLLTGYRGSLVPDRKARVSVKVLAMGCASHIVGINPKVFYDKLFKTTDGGDKAEDEQSLHDLLLYVGHSDPQLRGQCLMLIGQLLKASLVESNYNYTDWCWQICQETQTDPVSIDYLASLVSSSVTDESSVTARSICQAAKIFLPDLCKSCHGSLGLSLTYDLLRISKTTYWLVQVELLEMISGFDFRLLHFLETRQMAEQKRGYTFRKEDIQKVVLEEVLLRLLSSEDGRVRAAAGEALVQLIPKLFFPVDYPHQESVTALAKVEVSRYLDPVMRDPQPYTPAITTAMGQLAVFHSRLAEGVGSFSESVLSRMVAELFNVLNNSTSRHKTYGCVRALSCLSTAYPVTVHPCAWGCSQNVSSLSETSHPKLQRQSSLSYKGGSVGSTGSGASAEELAGGTGCGSLPVIVTLLTSSVTMLDLAAHHDMLQLAINLLLGAASNALKSNSKKKSSSTPSPDESGSESWQCLNNRLLVPIIDQALVHIVRLTSIFSHVIDGHQPGPAKSQTALPSLPAGPSLSPIKRKTKLGRDKDTPDQSPATPQTPGKPTPDKSDGTEEKKSNKSTYGSFYQHAHYMRFYEILRGAYKNYKATLELSKPDRFCQLLRMSLSCLGQLLELASITEVGQYVEEILGYLKSCVTIEPTLTILCVEQLLKALFFTNLANVQEYSSPIHARKPGKSARLTSNMKPGLYHDCFIAPYTQYTQCLASMGPKLSTTPDSENEYSGIFGLIRTRTDRRASVSSKSSKDKTAVQNYIRLFEPLVIRALKQYTVSSCVILQQQVLHLLAQLVQLRVNYCLLDSDQIFLNFVIKQFEYLEEGLVKGYEVLIPHIFNFLVLLSYERFHSKPVIAMPKIIQLCDGIMASGQQASTHIVPALKPLVHDLFILRASNKSESVKELDTQREVVVSMLLRLIHYSQVLEMLTSVLQQAHRENEEKWKRLSRQVVDMILPLLARQQINLDCPDALDVLHHLLATVAPSSLRPVDILLKALLLVPYEQVSVVSMQRWLAMALALIGVLTTQSKEETILSRLQELGLTCDLFICVLDAQHTKEDALSATLAPPEEVLARFLLQVIGFTVTMVQSIRAKKSVEKSGDISHDFLPQELSRLLLCMTHMFKSGAFRKVGAMMASLISRPQQTKCWFVLDQLNEAFYSIIQTDPVLVLQWCQLLLLLNYDTTEWWTQILRTPRRPPLSKSLSSGSLDHLETSQEQELSSAEEVVKQGALILFCDYVCENEADAEPLTWLVVNHVNDIVQLSYEFPVQDLVSAIHRNSAASGLFLRAINIRFSHMHHPCLVRQTLRLMEGIHLTQSGMLLTLLIEKFLGTHWQSIARVGSGLACRRIEMLLAERVDPNTRPQLSHDDVTKLEGFLVSIRISHKNQRLMSLLNRLKFDLTVDEPASTPPAMPSDLPRNLNHILLDKEWFLSIVQSCCCGSIPTSSARESAALLSRLAYEDIVAIMALEEFDQSILAECISLGLARTQISGQDQTQSIPSAQMPDIPNNPTAPSSGSERPVQASVVDDLLRAAASALIRNVKEFAALVPGPHRILEPHSENPEAQEHYGKTVDCFQDADWCRQLNDTVSSLGRYFLACRMLKFEVDKAAREGMITLTIASLELVSWSISEGKLLSSAQVLYSVECLAEILQHAELSTLIGGSDHVTWFCSAIGCLYHLIQAGKLWKQSQEPFTLPKHPEMLTTDPKFDICLQACHHVSEMIELQDEDNSPNARPSLLSKTPQFLIDQLRRALVGLARLPLVNGYARTPPVIWKMGWSPSPLGRAQTELPPIPLEFLKEKAVLRSFIQRVNTIGWTSRFQFEETWASLLGLLNPADNPEDSMLEEEIEQSELVCLAVRGITALLLNTILRPTAGNPTTSRPLCIPRHDSLPFLATQRGQRLARLRVLVERERQAMQSLRSQQTVIPPTSTAMEGPFDEMLTANMETEGNQGQFTLGQISVHGIWAINSMMLPLVEDPNQNGPEASIVPMTRTAIPAALSKASSGLDVHSCLVLLLEVYGQWLAPGSARHTSLMLFCETIKSVLLISDIFTERSQFEWMYETLLELNKIHPIEDELVSQYVIPGICKAASVLGMDKDVSEKVSKLLEVTLRSTHLPSRVGALYGVLYILESDAVEDIQVFVPMVTDYIVRNIKGISNSSSAASQKHVLVMLSVAFYIMEYYSHLTAGTDFTKVILQQCVTMVLMSDESTSWLVYRAIMVGFERLLVAHALNPQERDMLKKLSVDRLCLPSPMHAMSALGLLLTSMYTAEEGRGVGFEEDDSHHEMQPHDPEETLLAMERVSIMFDRIRKGYPSEARAVGFILPPFLNDFFPPQDIMNKVIGEFLSNQQPHPQLMATVVFKVFGNLHRSGQTQYVRDWVMLSLSNFTQRTPVAMAIWSLTCFLISASTNKWIRALLNHIISRMGKLEPLDRKYFIMVAKDFYNTQINDESSRRAFTATFQAVSAMDPSYALLV